MRRSMAWTLPFSVATHGHRVRRVYRRGIGFVGLMHGAWTLSCLGAGFKGYDVLGN